MAKPDLETKSENEVLGQGGSGMQFKPDRSSIRDVPFVDLSALGGSRFILTVDTEEEFDWNKPFAREGHGTEHLKAVPRFQALCGDFGVKPCYLVDYPITQDIFGADMLADYAQRGEAEIGVQLHPWVSPPFDEKLSVFNSYACNLPEPLERAKLSQLYSAIVKRFGVKPDSYRAGRYGAGKHSAAILVDLGISIDSSVRSRFNYASQGGPDYSRHPLNPYWIQKDRLIELPLTTMFGGVMRSAGDRVFGQWFGSQPARAMLARTGMVERIALTPEGISLRKALEGIDIAVADGVKVINLSFHSPSLAVGHTPYVRDESQLKELYNWFEGVFAHLVSLGIAPTTMAEIKAASGIRTTS